MTDVDQTDKPDDAVSDAKASSTPLRSTRKLGW